MTHDLTHTALSDRDVTRLVPHCQFVPYEDVHQFQSLRQLLPKSLLLYELARVGHFCCVFENNEGVNFFDPLGYQPDEELLLANPEYIERYHQDYTYLIRLLLQTKRPVIYNEYKLQASGTSTCGHWCTLRLLCSKLTNEQFVSLFDNVDDRDQIVAEVFQGLQRRHRHRYQS